MWECELREGEGEGGKNQVPTKKKWQGSRL